MAPPDPRSMLTLLALWVTLVLLVPKRSWRTIPRRLRETDAGRRAYVFGPPVHQGELLPDLFERFWQVLRRDWLRLVEMGLPVYALATVAEIRGLEARRRVEAEAALSPAGLLSQHLQGRFSETELHHRLADLGRPVPAPKLASARPGRYAAAPAGWAVQWRRHLQNLREGREGPPAQTRVVSEATHAESDGPRPTERAGLAIRTLGVIQILDGDKDLAGDLLHRPRQRFAWFLLLAREVLRQGDRILKPDFAEELFPSLDPRFQRASLRKRMSETMARLPRPLSERVVVEREQVGLDLSGCHLDVRWVLDLAETVTREGAALDGSLADEVERAVQLAREDFLPGWEEIEERATGSRGVAGEVVREVRERVSAAHVTLTLALADHLLAHRQPSRAIPYLEECLRRRADREDVATRLVRAYEETGQHRAATRLRETGALDEPE